MRKREKERLKRTVGNMGGMVFITLETYHKLQCLKCPYNPVKTEVKENDTKL